MLPVVPELVSRVPKDTFIGLPTVEDGNWPSAMPRASGSEARVCYALQPDNFGVKLGAGKGA